MTHEDLQALLGAYALDAVEPDEAVALELHITGCPRCAAEVAAHQEAAALVGHAGAEAPEGLWDRIAAALADDAGAGRANVSAPRLERPRRARRGRRPWPLAAVAAVASVAAAAAVLLGVDTAHLDHQVASLRSALSATGIQQEVGAALLDPRNTEISLRSPGGQPLASVLVRPDGGAYLVSSRLATLPASRTYQLWGRAAGQVVSLGLLPGGHQAVMFRVGPGPVQLMVTAEPAGGVVSPDSAILAMGQIPSGV